MEKKEKKFTWADLKKAANRVPKHLLSEDVIVWNEDGGGSLITGIEILKEDHLFDGDNASAPRSVMKEAIAEEKEDFPGEPTEYVVVHKKGKRILNGEHFHGE